MHHFGKKDAKGQGLLWKIRGMSRVLRFPEIDCVFVSISQILRCFFQFRIVRGEQYHIRHARREQGGKAAVSELVTCVTSLT